MKNKKKTGFLLAGVFTVSVLAIAGVRLSVGAATSVNAYIVKRDNLSQTVELNGSLESERSKSSYAEADVCVKTVSVNEPDFKKFPTQLSGGQQQRVAVVRGVINNPQVLFADVPTGALNSQNTQNVLNILTGLNEDGQSIVMVTHTLMAAERGNRIIYLADGVISDEVDLGPYLGDYKDESNPNREAAIARHAKLKTFLQNMGW